jgi:dTDP-4-amino-4,6-dideoxygalactose transaminase
MLSAFETIRVPVMRPRLPATEHLLPYLRRIDETCIYANYGPLTLEFEARLAAHLDLPRDCVTSASSGTAALVGAILARTGRAIPDRPYAIMPAYTFVATAAAVEQCGYTPYFADIDAGTWMQDPVRLANHPSLDRVGVVVAVAPFGRPVPQEPWLEFQNRTGIPVVIDGAASFTVPQTIGPIPVAISFHATKGFGIGEGGAVVCSDPELVGRAWQALNFGFKDGKRDARMPNTNGKLSEYPAAVGLAQFDTWAETRRRFEAVARDYRAALARAGCDRDFWATPDVGISYALFMCGSDAEAASLQDGLMKDGIQSRLWYGVGLHRQHYYASMPHEGLAVTEMVARRLIGLPMVADFTMEDLGHITDVIVTNRQQQLSATA